MSLQNKIKKYGLLLFSCFLLLISCDEHTEIKTIGETEFYFDEKLSSISEDEDGTFWVGSETGDLFNFNENAYTSFDLGEDRIYKVKKDIVGIGDTTFWIGVRNSGLQKWKKSGDAFEKQQTYAIRFKKDKYSSYDFTPVDDVLYVATSQGLYSLDKKQYSDTLSLIYPSVDFLSAKDGTTFLVHNICQVSKDLILASTQEGLLWYDIKNQSANLTMEGTHVEHVSLYNDTVFVLSKNHLNLCNIAGGLLKTIKLDNSPKVYFQNEGVHYFVGATELVLSNNLEDFYTLFLRRSVPINSRNLILSDKEQDFIYLLTDNAIWRLPSSIDVFKGTTAIKSACFNSDAYFYLSLQNELFMQKKNSEKAKWVYTFSKDDLIQWVDVIDNTLYFYDVNNKFQKMSVSDNWIKNFVLNSPQTIIDSDARITSANVRQIGHQTISFLGIQDGLLSVENDIKIDTIPELSKSYITSMFGHKHSDRLYISTLNDGVFHVRESEVKQILNTAYNSFIKDVITTNEHESNLVQLTNHYIISENPTDSIRVKGYKKLLYANDTLFYALAESGVHRFRILNDKIADEGILFKDIHFSTNSVIDGEYLILVSTVGAMHLPINEKLPPKWVHFNEPLNIFVLQLIVLTFFIALLVLSIGFVFVLLLKKRKAKVLQTKKEKEELINRLDDLLSYYDVIKQVENSEIGELRASIYAIDIDAKRRKTASLQLKDFSAQIATLNRRIALLLPKRIDEQIAILERLNAFEIPLLLESSSKAKAENDIESIKAQIDENESWLNQRNNWRKTLDEYIDKVADCVEIDGVNAGLFTKLSALDEEEAYKPIRELMESLDVLEEEIANIDSPHSTQLIKRHLLSMEYYLNEKIQKDKGLVFLLNDIEEAMQSVEVQQNIATLKMIKTLDAEVEVLKVLDEIQSNALKYQQVYNQIVDENDQRIHKKFDKELASEISAHTRIITQEINTHITSLYNLLMDIDGTFITNVLKLTNLEGQHAKVLALLIADKKMKRLLIPGMLGIYGNLNPVISRLINNRIKANESTLTEYQNTRNSKSVFVYLVQGLL